MTRVMYLVSDLRLMIDAVLLHLFEPFPFRRDFNRIQRDRASDLRFSGTLFQKSLPEPKSFSVEKAKSVAADKKYFLAKDITE